MSGPFQAGDVNDVSNLLPKIVGRASKVYTNLIGRTLSNSPISRLLRAQPVSQQDLADALGNAQFHPLKPLINKLRAVKSEGEIENMRKAGRASGRAITDAMRQHFSTEKALAAFLEYRFREGGCDSSAYVPVVAGGEVIYVLAIFTL